MIFDFLIFFVFIIAFFLLIRLVAVLRSGDYLLDIGGIPALPGFM